MIVALPSASHYAAPDAGKKHQLTDHKVSKLLPLRQAWKQQPLGRCPEPEWREVQDPCRQMPPSPSMIHHSITGWERRSGQASQPTSLTQTGSICNSNGIFLSLFFRSTVHQTGRQTDQNDNKRGLSLAPGLLVSILSALFYCVGWHVRPD